MKSHLCIQKINQAKAKQQKKQSAPPTPQQFNMNLTRHRPHFAALYGTCTFSKNMFVGWEETVVLSIVLATWMTLQAFWLHMTPAFHDIRINLYNMTRKWRERMQMDIYQKWREGQNTTRLQQVDFHAACDTSGMHLKYCFIAPNIRLT